MSRLAPRTSRISASLRDPPPILGVDALPFFMGNARFAPLSPLPRDGMGFVDFAHVYALGLSRPGRVYGADERAAAVQQFYPRLSLDRSVRGRPRLPRHDPHHA